MANPASLLLETIQQTLKRLSRDAASVKEVVACEESLGMPESKVHSFIVKLWLDDGEHRKGKSGWHGHITHVPSGERRYLKELQDIVAFIKSYVGDIDGTFISSVRRWLKS